MEAEKVLEIVTLPSKNCICTFKNMTTSVWDDKLFKINNHVIWSWDNWRWWTKVNKRKRRAPWTLLNLERELHSCVKWRKPPSLLSLKPEKLIPVFSFFQIQLETVWSKKRHNRKMTRDREGTKRCNRFRRGLCHSIAVLKFQQDSA